MVEQQQRSGAKVQERKAAAPFKSQEEPIFCPYIRFSKDGQRFRIECESEEQFIEGSDGKGVYVPEICAFCLQAKAVIGATFEQTRRDPIWERMHPSPGA